MPVNMKHTSYLQLSKYFASVLLAASCSMAGVSTLGQTKSAGQVISYVDTSLNGAEKYVLRVDGKPFYMTEIQVRLEKLRYLWNFDAASREAVIARAAADGFNTLSLPIHWAEVEPTKDHFDWTILDEYLGLCKKYHLKMEMLWFGNNSYGTTGVLIENKDKYHLRTPDYVLHSPAPHSNETTSDYKIRRDISNYTLDLADNNLRDREAYVLSRVMVHVAEWDKSNGSPHTVVGVQLDNEIRGQDNTNQFPDSVVLAYVNALGAAVKKSPYVVWTRINCVDVDARTRIEANYRLRKSQGTNVDFLGIDMYDYRAGNMRSPVPTTFNQGNYNMICESGAQIKEAAIFQLAALSGNNAYNHYDMLGPDGHGLYDRDGASGFKPHGSYIDDVRTVNKLLNSDMADIALKANGKSLFVHNWEGKSTDATTGVAGIKFTPASPIAQAISIIHSNTEIVLMNVGGGTFRYPASLGIVAASRGYFNQDNVWVDQGKIAFTATSVHPPVGSTIRLVRKK